MAFAKGYPGLRGNISRKVIPGSFSDLGGPQAARRAERAASSEEEPREERLRRATCAASARRSRKKIPWAGTYFDIFYHDATAATLKALAAVHGDLSGGEHRFMAALADVHLASPLGSIRLDKDHQAIASNYVYGGQTG